ncbi:type II secretory pathway, ATPase PulE/Tfp pilus assembly pathway, ATPase PilB [Solibacillus silvestris StLB046]|uniref:Type II secretory pathway, ATPase PulE/Tfp pilus assembly pathway, ATPase PilB n=1 Tax=Solibacillus silvestris (strain StLB046) TaxID=1002809 RepID=F2F449_SOLSS|nr:ATPase, T2SS/T4P/T4SS family [Solibacillus silvestris]BAK18079.1 type II secretory pathway, ATPase PulE/Tfp pilus assembly pathway, ATPase PilB [Solibacillus silvestris StLB046]
MKAKLRKRLGDLLVESGVISDEQLDYALKNKSRDEKLGDFLIKENVLTEQQLIEVLEFQLGIPHITLTKYAIDPELLQLVPRELAKRANIMPVRRDKNKLLIAMSDPMDYFAIEEVRMATGCQIETSIAAKDDLYRTITKYYDLQASMDAALSEVAASTAEVQQEITDEDSPIVRLVNQIIANGVAQRASDIHFDPQETEFKVRYRVDGVLKTERSLPKHMQNMMTARVKIIGGLNITENRIPQDGRIKVNIEFKSIDIRLSTLPTVYGEKIVMRILDISNAATNITYLGFTEKNEEMFKKMIEKPNGIVLITGPTGSGKSSTLYAALSNLNDEEVNIITVEDPVEYQLNGVNQIQVKEEVGLTFAAGLRSILRQDPDIIMIGEIRDLETAQISIRASLTGHLVLSTLHTNNAIESISRLQDMGIEPFLISSSLVGVLAQRLVRQICRDCSTEVEPTIREKQIFANNGFDVEKIHKGRGCSACGNTGYRGRLAIHELLPIDRELKDLILNQASGYEISDYMKSAGYYTLLQDGLQKVLEGVTTTEEVLRVATID